MMTFQEFQASRREVADLRGTDYACHLADEGEHPQPGYLYREIFAIEKRAPHWLIPNEFLLVIGSREYPSDTLQPLEEQLYEYACGEGACGEPEPVVAVPGQERRERIDALLAELEKLGHYEVLAIEREHVRDRIERDLTDAEADAIAADAALALGENELAELPLDDAIDDAADALARDAAELGEQP